MGIVESLFVIDDPKGSPGTLDIAKLMKVSDDFFAAWYRESMAEYVASHKAVTGNAPTCTNCITPVKTPDQLRRYHGASLHPACFAREYATDRASGTIEERVQPFWERVLALDKKY